MDLTFRSDYLWLTVSNHTLAFCLLHPHFQHTNFSQVNVIEKEMSLSRGHVCYWNIYTYIYLWKIICIVFLAEDVFHLSGQRRHSERDVAMEGESSYGRRIPEMQMKTRARRKPPASLCGPGLCMVWGAPGFGSPQHVRLLWWPGMGRCKREGEAHLVEVQGFFSRPGLSDTDSFGCHGKEGGKSSLPCPLRCGWGWYPLPGQPPSSFSCFWPYLVLLVLALLGQQSSLNLQKSIPQREGHCCLFCELIELTDWSIWLKHLPSALQPGHRGTSADWVLWRGGQGATGMTGQVCSFQEKQTKKTNITLKPLREQRAEAI